MIFNIYKQRGETPLECIRRFAQSRPELKGEKLTYMGRLDPLAEGVLLMASGEDVKRKEEFLGLDKEYDFVAIFGFATDTYDVLGKIVRMEKLKDLSEIDIRKVATVYEGERDQEYPKYSSKMIASRKSFSSESPRVAPTGSTRLSPENSFSNKITVYKINFHKSETLNSKELFGRLLMDISRVKGDFRQHEILTLWKQILLGSDIHTPIPKGGKAKKDTQWFLGRFSAHVSSGTYIRSLVNYMGNTLGCGATTLSIKRTRVGDYKIEESIKTN